MLQILDAALVEFSERGFNAARMDDIASRCGLSKGGLYAHFQSKEEIFKAVIREGMLTKFDELEGLSGQDEASAETRRLRQLGQQLDALVQRFRT